MNEQDVAKVVREELAKAGSAAKPLTNHAAVSTVSGFMRELQKEIDAIKSGEMAESTGRVVAKFRNIQLNSAQLQLQYARLNRAKDGYQDMPMKLDSEESK